MNETINREKQKQVTDLMKRLFEPKGSDCPKCDPKDFVSIESAIDPAKSFFVNMTGNEKFEKWVTDGLLQ